MAIVGDFSFLCDRQKKKKKKRIMKPMSSEYYIMCSDFGCNLIHLLKRKKNNGCVVC